MSDPGNPWGNRGGGKKPNDFDELINKGLKSLFGEKKPSPAGGPPSDDSGQPSGKGFGTIILVIILGMLGFMSVYQIQPGEQGVILRFGQFHSTASPGLNFMFPFVEKVIKVDVESIRKEEFGSNLSVRRGLGDNFQNSPGTDLQSLMLTSDLNVIQLSWVVQYKIRDPEMFLFNIESPRAAVRDVSEAVVRRLVGNRDFSYVLNNREELATSTKVEMQELLDKYNSGMQIVVVQLLDVNPPDSVRPSFNEVNVAEQDKIRLGNEAQQEANRRIPKAAGTALKTIDEAEGYAIETINNANGNVARFESVYKEYKASKTVTKTRMYLDALKGALPSLQEVIIVDQSKKGMMPLINIGAAALAKKPQIAASREAQPTQTPAP